MHSSHITAIPVLQRTGFHRGSAIDMSKRSVLHQEYELCDARSNSSPFTCSHIPELVEEENFSPCISDHFHVDFTALYAMHALHATRSSYDKDVRLSVCLSNV